MDLSFQPGTTDKDVKEIFSYNIDAFTDSIFKWTLENLRNEIKLGWQLFSVRLKDEIIAAVLFKKDGNKLLTQNTAIKPQFQGSGFNHQIKEFFELKALELGCEEIHHFCKIDNFRMYSLNESHGYKKLEKKSGDIQVMEWVKSLK
jgi:hypothetical protein